MNMEYNKFGCEHIEPGSLVFVKDRLLSFVRLGPPNEEGEKKATEIVCIDNDLALLVSITSKEVADQWYLDRLQRNFFITILYKDQMYINSTVVNETMLKEKFAFIKIPEPTAAVDAVDEWINNYFGFKGEIFRIKTSFRARRGNSQEIVNKTWKLPRRNAGYSDTILIPQGERIVALGARRHAGRQLIIFDFFVKNTLCWIEIASRKSNKSKTKTFRDFFSPAKGFTPYEKDLTAKECPEWMSCHDKTKEEDNWDAFDDEIE